MPPRKPRPLSQAPEARRKREYRRRQHDEVSLLLIEAGPVLKKALVKQIWIGKGETGDLEILADAVYDLLDCWARGTLEPDPTRR